jgi:hypothetical protein
VRLGFQGWPDREILKDLYVAAFAKVELPSSEAAQQAFGKIPSLAGLGQERFNSAVSSCSARMTAARIAAA